MSVHLDVERLRFSLSQKQLPNIEIQYICDAAEGDINELLLDIVSNAVSQALDFAVDIGADGFVDDMQIIPDSNGLYQITTHSGNLDYSKESKEMLPSLLKNAKTSAEGHKYKVIPIQQSDRVEHSMFSVLQARQDAIDEARAVLREQARAKKANITDVLRADLSRQVSAAHTVRDVSRNKSGKVEFRTASDKQDPTSSWVIPEKDADMTDFIHGLNRRIADSAREAIGQLMGSYYSSYVEI